MILRATKDLDVFIEISEDNALKMTKVLNEFGFKSPALKTEDFLSPETIIQQLNNVSCCGVIFISKWFLKCDKNY